MINYIQDISIVRDKSDLLVNTVNTVGVMGKGVALDFANKWPTIVAEYKKCCWNKSLKSGGCLLFDLPDGRKWAALATKNHWRNSSKVEWVQSGLKELAHLAKQAGIQSIAIPPPGCGNGGLDWEQIEPIVLSNLNEFDLNIYAQSTLNVKYNDKDTCNIQTNYKL